MTIKEYEVIFETNGFDSQIKQDLFITKFVDKINSCTYSKVPATLIPVTKDKIKVTNKVYTSALISVVITIQKPENEDVVIRNLKKIDKKINVRLVSIEYINGY